MISIEPNWNNDSIVRLSPSTISSTYAMHRAYRQVKTKSVDSNEK